MSGTAVLDSQKQVLSKVPLFSGLSESEMEFIAGRVVQANMRLDRSSWSRETRVPGLYRGFRPYPHLQDFS